MQTRYTDWTEAGWCCWSPRASCAASPRWLSLTSWTELLTKSKIRSSFLHQGQWSNMCIHLTVSTESVFFPHTSAVFHVVGNLEISWECKWIFFLRGGGVFKERTTYLKTCRRACRFVALRHRILWIKGTKPWTHAVTMCSDLNQPNHCFCFSALLFALLCLNIHTCVSVCVYILPPVNKTSHFYPPHVSLSFPRGNKHTSW